MNGLPALSGAFRRCGGWRRAACDALFRRARQAAGIDGLHFHDSRREATTRLAAKLDVLTLARAGGWRDVNLLLRVYYAPSASDAAKRLR